MTNTSKSVPKKKKYEDRNAVSKVAFEPVAIEAKIPKTVVLLLACDEESVLMQALSSLDKYAAKSEQNVQQLCSANILQPLAPLLQHPQLLIKRFAVKLLSELCFCLEVRDKLLEEESYVKYFMEYLKANEDTVLKEFSSSIVAELTKVTEGYAQLIDCGMIDVLLPNLQCTDPDVQKNCLEIINNILIDPCAKDLLIHSSGFQFHPFLDLLSSDYPVIQNLTLDILTSLTEWRTDNFLQELFLKAGGIEKLMDTIEDYGMKDIHNKCLNVLGNVCDNPLVLKTLQSDGTNRLLRYMDNIHDVDLRLQTIRVILKLVTTPVGRRILIENEIVQKIVPIILEESIGITSSVCHGLIHLVQEPTALRQIIEENTIEFLFLIIKQDNRDWDTRGAAVTALYEILQRDTKSCVEFVADRKQIILQNILLDRQNQLPVNVATSIANCFTLLAGIDEVRDQLVDSDLVKVLLHCFKEKQEDTTVLKIAACEAFNALMCNTDARKLLHAENGLGIIWNSLTKSSTSLPLLQVAANLIYFAIVNDKTLASDLYQLGAFAWLMEYKSLRYECPAWDVALEIFLNSFLPLKFAYTGRLDLTDVTESNFYITRAPIRPDKVLKGEFPNLQDLIRACACPSRIIYVANFGNSDIASDQVNRKESKSATAAKKPKILLSTRESIESVKPLLHTEDIYLCDYLERVRYEIHKLNTEDNLFINMERVSKGHSAVDGSFVRAMAKILGKFVSDQLCGPDSTQPCTDHTLNLHLAELKLELQTCLLFIGYLRVGLHLERALLFKVLADQVGLPCCLVRGEYGRSWVEVAVPELPPTPRPAYPSKLLRPNFIVDLMNKPGVLMPLKSHEANLYCKN